jgi:2-polyprenyl-6-methoxyphenol hydroxylase-like FAD-dependent oxidoreductase
LKLPESNKVIVVDAGPVGLIASLLLSKYYVPHVLVEQLAEPDDHPQAHFINCRSMEILRELDPLTFEPDLKLGGRIPHFLVGRQGWSKNFSPGFTIFDDRRRPLALLCISDRWQSGKDT